MAISLYSPEIEQHCLGLILRYPDLFADISFIAEKDFGTVRQRIYSVIRQQLEQVPAASVAPIILTEKLKSYGITAIEGVDMFTYLDGLSNRGRMLDKEQIVPLAKELKKMTVKRELIDKCDEAKQKVMKADTVEDMSNAVTQTITDIGTSYYHEGNTTQLFKNMRARIEASGAAEKEDLGYVGVIPSMDRTLGPLFRKGSFTNISSRSGGGKSSFGFYYAVSTAEAHNLPILWLDAGEMTDEELEDRAICCFSKGKIPLWAAVGNGWRRNKEWTDLMRGEVFPRAEKLIGRFHYKNVSGMTAKEKTAFVRRFYYNKIGRGNFLIIVDDYLKAIESMGKETKEYQAVGYYTSDMKSLVTTEIDAGFMTFTQSNRFGISKGKKITDIVDNDSVISVSDRIKDNCTANFLMRYKVTEELAREKNSFGNVVLKNLKIRQARGRDYASFAQPIKMSDGSFAEDYFNLDYHGFHYRDMGLFSEIQKKLGYVAIDLGKREGDEPLP
jgi:replicative DNA helicase